MPAGANRAVAASLDQEYGMQDVPAAAGPYGKEELTIRSRVAAKLTDILLQC